MSQSVLKDRFQCRLPSLDKRSRRETINRHLEGTLQVASKWKQALEKGDVKNRAELARRTGISRARVSQVLGSDKLLT